MKNIAIYGAGGFGREVACLLQMINDHEPTWKLVGFFDDGRKKGSFNEYGEILGGLSEMNNWHEKLNVVIAIGSPHIVHKIVTSTNNPNIDFPNIIAPGTVFFDKEHFAMGRGNLVCHDCLFSTNVKIGDFNCFNGAITVGHDVSVGNFNSFMPGARVSGEVQIVERNYFGVGSIVLQQVKIGSDTVIGAGSVIIRKTKNGNTYLGNPATIVKY